MPEDKIIQTENIDRLLLRKSIKPQHEWGWQVAVYLYLAGIGSGSLALGILMGWLGYVPDDLRPVILWGPVLVAIGALFLVLKLGVKRRFLNTILNPMTSWLSRGFYILSACIVIGVIILGISILPYLGVDVDGLSPLVSVLDVLGFMFGLATAIYTGILIMSVKYVPFWNTWLLPSLFTVSALSTGAMAVMLSSRIYNILTSGAGFPEQMMNTLTGIEQVIILIEVIVVILYLLLRYRADEYGMYSVRLLLSGRMRYIFWIGIAVSGFFIPVVIEGIYSRFHEQHFLLFLAGAFLLTGGFFIRYAVIYAGIKEQPPMLRLVENQRETDALSKAKIKKAIQKGVS